jgi:hypothetical protein
MEHIENVLNRVAQTLALMRSMIESGEGFTEDSRKAYERALQDVEWVRSLQ